MAGSDDETTPPGWYRQQEDPTTLRWWDGDDWTDDTMPAPGVGGRRGGRLAAAEAQGDDEVQDEVQVEAPAPGRTARTSAIPIATGARTEAIDRPRVRGVAEPRGVAERRPERRLPRPPEARTTPPGTVEDDWAADAWAAGARGPSTPARRPSPNPTPRVPAAPSALRDGRRSPGDAVARGPGPRRLPDDSRRRSGPQRPGPTRPAADPRRIGAPAAGARGPSPERAGRRDSRVVERPGAPPVVRVGLRALLIAALVGVGYLGYLQIENAEPEHARTVAEGESPEPTVDPDASSLDEVVLTLADLPAGWEAQAVDPAADDVCQGRMPRSVIQPLEITRSGFTRGEAGPFITNVVAAFADEDTAKAFLDLTARTIESCRTYEVEGGTAVELGPLEFPNFGDDSFVAEAVGESPYGELAGDIIYVRVGSRVTSVETIAFGEDTISPELVEHLTRLVANRM